MEGAAAASRGRADRTTPQPPPRGSGACAWTTAATTGFRARSSDASMRASRIVEREGDLVRGAHSEGRRHPWHHAGHDGARGHRARPVAGLACLPL